MKQILKKKNNWLVTGVAGFIGSNIAETLLEFDQSVIGLDNFSTGSQENLKSFISHPQFEFIEMDICSSELIPSLNSKGIDYILHQAALGSVPRSIENPLDSHRANVSGFVNILELARDINCKKLVYASSSAVYGDDQTLPKVESSIGQPLSPYAATKRINEVYASTYFQTYNLNSVGLRYFNVFGKRQDPNGAYAAVIPKWINLLNNNEQITIYGDGSNTTRDYCHVDDIVQANIRSALAENNEPLILNIGTGEDTNLNSLAQSIIQQMKKLDIKTQENINYEDMRSGDIVHSVASIKNAERLISYAPKISLGDGLKETIEFFIGR